MPARWLGSKAVVPGRGSMRTTRRGSMPVTSPGPRRVTSTPPLPALVMVTPTFTAARRARAWPVSAMSTSATIPRRHHGRNV